MCVKSNVVAVYNYYAVTRSNIVLENKLTKEFSSRWGRWAVRVPIGDVEAGGGAHAAVNRKCRLRLLVDAPLPL